MSEPSAGTRDSIAVLVEAMSLEGEGNRSLRLIAADGGVLPSFEAGAHVDLHLPGGLRRPYSIASSPAHNDHYCLCVKREPQSRGGSAAVHDTVRVGDRLDISPPRSLFRLAAGDHHVLMAGGIGITPLLAMAEVLAQQGASFELHYYVRKRSQIAFRHRLADGFASGRVHIHVEEEGESAIDAAPDALSKPNPHGQIYLCGPEPFMVAMAIRATEAGWRKDHIHREAFAPASTPLETTATGDRAFEVELARDGRVFTVPADRSIAAVLVEAGVAVPLSCEMGICGACLTPVLSGSVDHRDEVTGGVGEQIALCCSRSVGERILIDL